MSLQNDWFNVSIFIQIEHTHKKVTKIRFSFAINAVNIVDLVVVFEKMTSLSKDTHVYMN